MMKRTGESLGAQVKVLAGHTTKYFGHPDPLSISFGRIAGDETSDIRSMHMQPPTSVQFHHFEFEIGGSITDGSK